MFWKSVQKEDNAFWLDELFVLIHQLFHEILSIIEDVFFDSLNPKLSTISFATSHLVINCSQFPARTNWFLEVVDNTEVTSHRESNLLGEKETQFGVWESIESQTWDSRQNSRYGEYVELYEAFSKLVKW